jgi:hypothetical protein
MTDYIIELSREQSIKYHEDENFREDINSRYKKISLDLNYNRKIKNANTLKQVYKLCMYNCKSITCINSLKLINELNLKRCKNITDVNNLRSLNILNLYDCKKIKDVGNLRNLKELTINREVYGIEFLKKLKYLKIYGKIKNIKSSIKKLKQINPNVIINLFISNN